MLMQIEVEAITFTGTNSASVLADLIEIQNVKAVIYKRDPNNVEFLFHNGIESLQYTLTQGRTALFLPGNKVSVLRADEIEKLR